MSLTYFILKTIGSGIYLAIFNTDFQFSLFRLGEKLFSNFEDNQEILGALIFFLIFSYKSSKL